MYIQRARSFFTKSCLYINVYRTNIPRYSDFKNLLKRAEIRFKKMQVEKMNHLKQLLMLPMNISSYFHFYLADCQHCVY